MASSRPWYSGKISAGTPPAKADTRDSRIIVSRADVERRRAGPWSERRVSQQAAPLESFAPRVMILPLINLSQAPDHAHVSSGLTIDITTELSKFPILRVLSLNTAMTFKDRPVPPQWLHESLGVRYLLEGCVELSGDRFVVTAQLIDAEVDQEIWADRFERPGAWCLEDYDEQVRQIVAALAHRIAEVEAERTRDKSSTEVNAYEAYQKALRSYSEDTKDQLLAARDMFKRATELDPNFARAWGHRAYATIRGVSLGWIEPDAMDQAHGWVSRAIELDPTDYSNIWDLAFLHQNCGRFVQAERAYNKAHRLNPNDAELLAEMAEFSICNGTPDLAIGQLNRAIEISPNMPHWVDWTLGYAYFAARDYERAVAQLGKRSAPPLHVRLVIAACLVCLGERARAKAIVAELVEQDPALTIGTLLRRDRHRRPEDRAHWIDALRLAGVPDDAPQSDECRSLGDLAPVGAHARLCQTSS